MPNVQIHQINFFEPEPKAIHCLAYDASVSRLAVSRADFAIEIWDMQGNPFLEKIIPGYPPNSVEAITWCDGRLFSVGLHSFITEYNLVTLMPKYSIAATSPLWCVAVNKQKTLIAAGSEDGHVVLYKLSSEGLDFELNFNKQEGRILCLAWHMHGKVIVTGSINTIRVWDVETGTIVNRILIPTVSSRTETTVWCLAVTTDMTIISGDSRGKICFWDGNNGTLQSSTDIHKKDVLALCLSEEEDVIYTTGVDHIIVMHIRSKVGGEWISSVKRIVHTNDVRAVVFAGQFLASGGVDSYLIFTKYPPNTVVQCFPFAHKTYCSVSTKKALVLLMYPTFLELWKLGSGSSTLKLEKKKLAVTAEPLKLIQMKAKDHERIICSDISDDGKWIAYSTLSKFRLFYVTIDASSELPDIQKVNLPEEFPKIARIVKFFSKNSNFVMYSGNKMYIMECNIIEPKIVGTLEESTDSLGLAHMLEISPNDKYLAYASHNGHVLVYNMKKGTNFRLPHYKYQPTTLTFTPDSEKLLVVYTDRKIVEYILSHRKYSDLCKSETLQNLQMSSYNPITNACFVSNVLVLQEENLLYSLKKSDDAKSPKKRPKHLEDSENECESLDLIVVKKYRNISSIHNFSDNNLIVIEVSSDHIMKGLPPPIWEKKYGT